MDGNIKKSETNDFVSGEKIYPNWKKHDFETFYQQESI